MADAVRTTVVFSRSGEERRRTVERLPSPDETPRRLARALRPQLTRIFDDLEHAGTPADR